MLRTVVFTVTIGLTLATGASLAVDDLYVYPIKNQSEEQIGRDKQECHDWAVKQTGVDPVKMASEPSPSAKGGGAGGAAAGAGIGAARGGIEGDPGAGAMQGAAMGRLIHVLRARRQMEQQHETYTQNYQAREAQLQNYDRAYSACLTGRGYSVR
jgi:hypothetical protein